MKIFQHEHLLSYKLAICTIVTIVTIVTILMHDSTIRQTLQAL